MFSRRLCRPVDLAAKNGCSLRMGILFSSTQEISSLLYPAQAGHQRLQEEHGIHTPPAYSSLRADRPADVVMLCALSPVEHLGHRPPLRTPRLGSTQEGLVHIREGS
jgi:hypothetical protein